MTADAGSAWTGHRPGRRDLAPATLAVETTMVRGLGLLRVILLAYAVYWNLTSRWPRYEEGHPTLALVVLASLAVWTAFTLWAYDKPSRRTPALLGADLAVAVSTMLVTPYLQGADSVTATLPTFWVFGVVIAWAVRFHVVGGLVAAAATTAADLVVKLEPGDTMRSVTLQNLMLLWIGGVTIGYLTGLLQRMAAERDAAERRAAAVEERARLARAVHDGTLQVLALVQRRGQELGGDFSELARLAGEQEASLRALIQANAAAFEAGGSNAGQADLVTRLTTFHTSTVAVSGPGGPVLLPEPVVDEVASAVSECLTNVARHVGNDAPAWVLVEDLGSSVVVTVRDEGPGIDEQRLPAARSEGRLGVAECICGRMSGVGGDARLTTAPGHGVEWELTVPKDNP
jgi:signal transduction histidine kinase